MEDYIRKLRWVIDALSIEPIAGIAGILRDARAFHFNVYLIGNGGSASTAEHFACDLNRQGIKATCLTSNMATLTSFANDWGYKRAVTSHLDIVLEPHDILIAISVSGNSKNIVSAVKSVDNRDIWIVGMTGKEGGKLTNLVDINLSVPSDDQQIVEDLHLIMCHMIVRML
jgi:D-sedoheptulose 7-phosphate isomerase